MITDAEINALAKALARIATALSVATTPERRASLNADLSEAYNQLQYGFESQTSVIKDTLSIAQACCRRLPLDDYSNAALLAARSSLRHMACTESRAGNNKEFWRLEFASRYLDAQIKARGIRL
ncbi:hypothetical protein [Herpetosiphon geysericola]|uniref:Uncharacterized protein n=1 Tax=Herpetosiphon geysericola TaxID=70996 RepID=A0A0P6YXQ4_9CHLR|nr:hypothetical protein [Herpetosiphon geysericola]KPL90013.1 hypothetical protein SE18_08660 [Herpetosiphon geysericola]